MTLPLSINIRNWVGATLLIHFPWNSIHFSSVCSSTRDCVHEKSSDNRQHLVWIFYLFIALNTHHLNSSHRWTSGVNFTMVFFLLGTSKSKPKANETQSNVSWEKWECLPDSLSLLIRLVDSMWLLRFVLHAFFSGGAIWTRNLSSILLRWQIYEPFTAEHMDWIQDLSLISDHTISIGSFLCQFNCV